MRLHLRLCTQLGRVTCTWVAAVVPSQSLTMVLSFCCKEEVRLYAHAAQNLIEVRKSPASEGKTARQRLVRYRCTGIVLFAYSF